MASLPARRPSQRRPSPTEQSQAPSSQSHVASSRSRSEDSQTIFVNKPDEEEHQQSQLDQLDPRPDPADDPNVKRCWVCYSDSTEDTPESSLWRDPCPCALVAHEQCLLDWIADMEAPRQDGRGGVAARKIECPQCKSEIQLARPRDYLVEAVRGLERAGAKMITPAAGYLVFHWLKQASMAWGVQSIYDVFGREDAIRILHPPVQHYPTPAYVIEALGRDAGERAYRNLLERILHWRLNVGVPLIAPVLILSRTRLADGVLPVLPIVFFASQMHSPHDALDFASWPPSASFSFALLPYVRGLYNACYRKLFAEKEKRWMEEIQARRNTDGENGEAEANDGDPPRGDNENVFEVRIDRGIWDDWEDDEPPAQANANAAAQQADDDEGAPAPNVQDNRPVPNGGGNEVRMEQDAPAPLQDRADLYGRGQGILRDEDEGAPVPDVQANRPVPNGGANEAPPVQPQAQPAQPAQPERVERRLAFSPTAIAESVIGALLFPRIANLAGELLLRWLPSSWTRAPAPSSSWLFNVPPAPKPFLANKWARSLVGGCLFVVCKDAIMLYVRWKMVQMHRSRRVLDYDRRRAAAS